MGYLNVHKTDHKRGLKKKYNSLLQKVNTFLNNDQLPPSRLQDLDKQVKELNSILTRIGDYTPKETRNGFNL